MKAWYAGSCHNPIIMHIAHGGPSWKKGTHENNQCQVIVALHNYATALANIRIHNVLKLGKRKRERIAFGSSGMSMSSEYRQISGGEELSHLLTTLKECFPISKPVSFLGPTGKP